jgi:hypothetical protein
MASSLEALSLQRSNLPTFPGADIPAQLASGRDAALGILQKYLGDFEIDALQAAQALSEVGVWVERNSQVLANQLANPGAQNLEQSMALYLGSGRVQNFIVASYWSAARGLGPYLGGAVYASTQTGGPVDQVWAVEDSGRRLRVFGAIVRMEESGFLAKVFTPQQQATSGLGLAPIVAAAIASGWFWTAVTVVSLGIVALLLTYFYNVQKLEAGNRILADMCKRAQEQGDTATVEKCIEEAAAMTKPDEGIIGTLSTATKVMIWGGVAFIAWKYVWPMVRDASTSRRRAGAH